MDPAADASIATDSGDLVDFSVTPSPDAGSDASVPDGGTLVPTVIVPRTGISPDELGVLVNDDDPLSVSVADYYVSARQIPIANVVHLHLPTSPGISSADFAPLKAQVDAAFAGTSVQALAITWIHPFTVGYMSITSAFAMGYRTIVGTNTCADANATYAGLNPYLGHQDSTRPFTDLAVPTLRLRADIVGPDEPYRDRRLPWAALMKRTWGLSVLVCPRCAGPMRLVSVIEDERVAGKILRHLGLPARAPPRGRAWRPGQQQLALRDDGDRFDDIDQSPVEN